VGLGRCISCFDRCCHLCQCWRINSYSCLAYRSVCRVMSPKVLLTVGLDPKGTSCLECWASVKFVQARSTALSHAQRSEHDHAKQVSSANRCSVNSFQNNYKFKPLKHERERERIVTKRKSWGEVRVTLLQGEKGHHFVRRFPSFTRSSFW
jgi:hypothetical protein